MSGLRRKICGPLGKVVLSIVMRTWRGQYARIERNIVVGHGAGFNGNTDRRNGERNLEICMPTRRRICKQVFHSSFYEGEDVLVETNDVDLICLDHA